MSATQAYDRVLGPEHEGSAWMRNRLRKIERQARKLGLHAIGVPVMVPLGRSLGFADAIDDRTCDRCRSFVPVGEVCTTLTIRWAPWLLVVGGLCDRCADLEGFTPGGDQ